MKDPALLDNLIAEVYHLKTEVQKTFGSLASRSTQLETRCQCLECGAVLGAFNHHESPV